MAYARRFGKRVVLPSTVQIVRELMALMRHDSAATPAAPSPVPVLAEPRIGAPELEMTSAPLVTP